VTDFIVMILLVAAVLELILQDWIAAGALIAVVRI
jgi:type IV secretory pathway TrbD component